MRIRYDFDCYGQIVFIYSMSTLCLKIDFLPYGQTIILGIMSILDNSAPHYLCPRPLQEVVCPLRIERLEVGVVDGRVAHLIVMQEIGICDLSPTFNQLQSVHLNAKKGWHTKLR